MHRDSNARLDDDDWTADTVQLSILPDAYKYRIESVESPSLHRSMPGSHGMVRD